MCSTSCDVTGRNTSYSKSISWCEVASPTIRTIVFGVNGAFLLTSIYLSRWYESEIEFTWPWTDPPFSASERFVSALTTQSLKRRL